MNATIEQAIRNERNLSINQIGYGRYRITCDYRGMSISTTTTNTHAIDDFNSDLDEVRDGRNRRRAGYIALCEACINANIGR